MSDFLTRSAPLNDIDRTGRTLEGLAFRWEHPQRVTDGGPYYLEEIARAATKKTLTDRPSRPLGILHPWSEGARTSPIPIGSVRFEEAAEGLVFRAIVSKTQAGDEALELVLDEALTDVSIGARPIRSSTRQSTAGLVTRREEIALRELSLAPTGMGQYEDARVLAVRAMAEGAPRLAEYRRRALELTTW